MVSGATGSGLVFIFLCKFFWWSFEYFVYVLDYSGFTNALWDLSTYFKNDTDVVASLNKLIHALQEVHKFHAILVDQTQRTILKSLTAFIKR